MSPNDYHVPPLLTVIRLCCGSGKCMIYGYTVSQMGHADEVHFYPRRIGGLHGHTKKFTHPTSELREEEEEEEKQAFFRIWGLVGTG